MVSKKVIGEGGRSVKHRCRSLLPGIAYPKGPCPGGAKGFTVVEMMVALVILTVGILGAVSMQINSIRGNATANKMTEASVVASDRAERLLSLGFDSTSLANGSETVGGYEVAWVVAAGPVGADSRDMKVTVSWDINGKTHSFDYRFLKVKNM